MIIIEYKWGMPLTMDQKDQIIDGVSELIKQHRSCFKINGTVKVVVPAGPNGLPQYDPDLVGKNFQLLQEAQTLIYECVDRVLKDISEARKNPRSE